MNGSSASDCCHEDNLPHCAQQYPLPHCCAHTHQPCTVDAMNPNRMQCPAPTILSTNGSVGQTTIGLLMDGVRDLLTLNSTVTVHPDPSFTMFEVVQEFSQNEDIILTIQVADVTMMSLWCNRIGITTLY